MAYTLVIVPPKRGRVCAGHVLLFEHLTRLGFGRMFYARMPFLTATQTHFGSAENIQKFVAEETRSTEVQLKENPFWAGHLTSSSQNQENPDNILRHVSNLSGVTPQSTKDAANKYLSGNNLIKFILLPEKAAEPAKK